MPPEAEFVIVVRKNRPSLRLPDPDPRDAEIRALKYELARVRGVREAIPGEGDLHVFSFLTKIREVLGCNKFGYDLVDAIKAMKEELEKTKKEAAFGRASLEHAKALGIDTNKELGQQYRALRRDAEAWRASRSGGASGGNVQHLGVCFPAGGSPVMIPASMSCDPNRVFDYTAGYIAGKGAK